MVSISKLDSSKASGLQHGYIQPGNLPSNAGSIKKNETKKNHPRHRIQSVDSSKKSDYTNSKYTGQSQRSSTNLNMTNSALKSKAEEFKAQNLSQYKKSLKMNTQHKDTIDSGAIYSEQLGESFVPPQMVDNSAVLFSNTKRKTNKFQRNNVVNHLQSEAESNNYNQENDDKSIVQLKSENGGYTQQDEEGEYGEGESYTSSCS